MTATDHRDPATGVVLWSIGDDSLSPHQFSATRLSGDDTLNPHQTNATRAAEDGPDIPRFIVGQSDPATDWPRLHPGPLDAAAGFRDVPVLVEFELSADDAAAAGLHLVVDLYASHGPCPEVRLDVNGQLGRYVLQPTRTSRVDAFARPSPIAGVVHLAAALPVGAVQPGLNRLTITMGAPELPSPDELSAARLPHLGAWFGSAVTWRRLALERRTAPTAPDVVITPLPLYVERDGDLRELVDLRVRVAQCLPDTAVDIAIGWDTYRATVSMAGYHFGDAVARFEVPASDAPASGRVLVDVAGTRHSYDTEFRPRRKWTLHLMPLVHLDLGYTDDQGKVLELHSRNLERALDLVAERDNFRFTVDGACTVTDFLATRSPTRTDAAVAAFTDGHLDINAYALLFLSGLASLDELLHGTAASMRLRDTLGIRVTHAHLTDVPSYSWAVPSTLAALGIDGFVGISNHARGGSPTSDALHLMSPVRWAGPDDRDVLAFFADCYSQLRFLCADPPTVPGMADGFTRLTELYDRDEYLPNDLPVVGTHADNEDLADGYADVVARWNAQYAYPRLRFSTFSEYLDAVRPLRDQLPQVRGDGGSYWEDHAGTQAATITRYRDAQRQLAASETISALLPLHYPGIAVDRDTLGDAWQHLFIGSEHTWTAGHATIRPQSPAIEAQLDWKRHQIESAWRTAYDEGRRAVSQLAELLALRHPQLVVVNPASRVRSLDITCDLPAGSVVLDASGAALAVEQIGEPADGYAPVRVRVSDVPSFGYRVLTIAAGPERSPAVLATEADVTTAKYVVRVDPATGRVVGLTHRASGRQLIDPSSPYSLAEVLYVRGGGSAEERGLTHPTSLFDFDPHLMPPDLAVHPATMRYQGHTRVPGGHVVRFAGSAPTVPEVRVEVRFFDDTDRVDVTVKLTKEHERAKESVYVAFPFLVRDPTIHYDRQIGWVDPSRDHLPGACNEWFAVQQGVAVTGADCGVVLATVDVPLITLDLVRGTWAATCEPQNGQVLSWAMNNYWWTNTAPSQAGTVELRYAFAPVEGWDEAAASAFVRDVRTPALVNEVTAQDRTMPGTARLPADSGQLLQVDLPPNVDAALRVSSSPGAVVVRLHEIGGAAGVARVRHPAGPCGRATAGRAGHEAAAPLAVGPAGEVELELAPYQIATMTLLAPP